MSHQDYQHFFKSYFQQEKIVTDWHICPDDTQITLETEVCSQTVFIKYRGVLQSIERVRPQAVYNLKIMQQLVAKEKEGRKRQGYTITIYTIYYTYHAGRGDVEWSTQ